MAEMSVAINTDFASREAGLESEAGLEPEAGLESEAGLEPEAAALMLLVQSSDETHHDHSDNQTAKSVPISFDFDPELQDVLQNCPPETEDESNPLAATRPHYQGLVRPCIEKPWPDEWATPKHRRRRSTHKSGGKRAKQSSKKQEPKTRSKKGDKKRRLARIKTEFPPSVINAKTGLATPTSARLPNMASKMPREDVFGRYYDSNDWVVNHGRKAAAPWVPDPMDDTAQPLSDAEREAKRQRRQAKLADKNMCRDKTRTEEKKLPGLLRLPAEVRIRIWHELLVTPAPILVHDGWSKVYKRQRQRQGLLGKKQDADHHHIGILGVCKEIHQEALAVLYGANTFVYRLRDATDSPDESTSLEQLPKRRNSSTGAGTRPRRRGAQQDAKKAQDSMERHIHVDAHLHLFRHIAVEAEHNRFSDSTRTAMANAIRVFMPRSEAPAVGEKRKGRDGEEAVQPNLRTLTIRVAPRWVSPVVLEQDDAADESDSNEMSLIAFGPNVSDHDGEDDGEHGSDGGQDSNSIDAQDTSGVQPSHFTFVDFFAQDSPVVEAIKAVVSRFVRIELMSQFQVGSSTKLGCCMTMDRYYQVPIKPHTDPWRRDIQMRRQRRLKEAAFGIAMQNLGESVSRFCANHFQAKTSGVAAVSGWHGFHESSSDYED